MVKQIFFSICFSMAIFLFLLNVKAYPFTVRVYYKNTFILYTD